MNPLRELEQSVLAEGREWTRRELEKRLQEQACTMPALCPGSGEALSQSRWQDLQLATVSGVVRVRVRYGYSVALQRWVSPTREAWGLEAYQRVSPELQARLAYTATEAGSYERAARLAEVWGSPTSDDCIHHHVQQLGSAAQSLSLPTPVPLAHEPPFSLVIMMDGWMARERGPDWAAGPRCKDPQRVTWHEIKSAVIYQLHQRATSGGRGLLLEKFIVATPPDTAPVDFGAAVQAEAMRRGLARAKAVYLVMDGAVWLWDLAEDRFAEAHKTLDFHHAREHLQTVAEALHGASTEAARQWLEKHLHALRHGKETRVVRQLEKLLTSSAERPPETQALIQREVHYFQKHRDHLHYQSMEQAGAPLGSGAVESLGKQLQARLRGCGQFWQRPGLTHLLRLNVLFKNSDACHLWN